MPTSRKYEFYQLAVGQSCFSPFPPAMSKAERAAMRKRIGVSAANHAARAGKKFSLRTYEQDGVLGIGVWREPDPGPTTS